MINRDLYDNLKNKNITKAQYIEKMYEIHRHLFDYANGIKDTNIQSIEITEGKVIMTTRDKSIKLEVMAGAERSVPIEMINFGDYEGEEWKLISRIIEKKKIKFMIDVGANMGYISLLMKKQFPDMNIAAFEPIESTYHILKNNIELNALEIQAVHMGLSDEEGVLTYYFYPEDPGNTSLVNLSERSSVVEIKTNVTTLDKYVEINKLTEVDFIKCDVEGAEFKVLKGGEKTLYKYKPVVYAELLRKWSAKFGYKPNDVIEWMTELGYECFVIIDNGIKKIKEINEETVETNFLFLQKEKHKDIVESFMN